jgi:hypothetical protein
MGVVTSDLKRRSADWAQDLAVDWLTAVGDVAAADALQGGVGAAAAWPEQLRAGSSGCITLCLLGFFHEPQRWHCSS